MDAGMVRKRLVFAVKRRRHITMDAPSQICWRHHFCQGIPRNFGHFFAISFLGIARNESEQKISKINFPKTIQMNNHNHLQNRTEETR